MPGVTHLSGLDGRDDLIAALHDAMLDHAKPTPPRRLGPVGEDHLRRCSTTSTAWRGLWYKSAEIVVGGIPWIIEVAVADTAKPGGTWFACNHAPAFGDPLGRTEFEAGDVWATARSRSSKRHATSSDGSNHAAVVHVICAAPQFMDKGKVTLVVPPAVADCAARALDEATKTLRKEAEQRRKDARKAEQAEQRRREAAAREERKDEWTIKDAVFEVLLEAKAAAGLIVAVRTLYYKVRPLVQKYTDKELNYDYFSQTLVPEYEREHEALEGLYYEARGELHHPHDGTVTQLGTREVEGLRRCRSGSSTRCSTSRRRACRPSSRPTSSARSTTWPSSTGRAIRWSRAGICWRAPSSAT